MARRADPYSNLTFAGHVDWKHVDPRLLQTLNRMAKKRGVIIDVISGYRSDAYSAKVGGFAGDPHTKGIAVDAYVDGKPIGDVIPVSDFAKVGLLSGNTPNFYKGKTDPEHVQLSSGGSYTTGKPMKTSGGSSGGASPSSQSQASGLSYGATSGDLVNQDLSASQPLPGAPVITANVMGLPGTALVDEGNPQPPAETWQLLSQLPGASPDTIRLAGLSNQ